MWRMNHTVGEVDGGWSTLNVDCDYYGLSCRRVAARCKTNQGDPWRAPIDVGCLGID